MPVIDVATMAVVAAIGAVTVLRYLARELSRWGRAVLAIVFGILMFALRVAWNIPALNDRVLAAIAMYALCAVLLGGIAGMAYWALWRPADDRPPAAQAWRWSLGLGLVG